MRWQFYFAFISDLGRSGEGEPDLYNITEKIEISGLQVRYGEKQALKGITFSVYEKEIVGIIGPAQSGKTTLLKTLNHIGP